MRRIAILTRHIYPNYGSLLQAYALQEAFRREGAEVTIVDYLRAEDTPLRLAASTHRISNYGSGSAGRLAYLTVQTPVFMTMGLVFRRYQRRLLRLTRSVQKFEELESLCGEFDAVVVGSDQVWNRIRGTLDEAYFLKACDVSTKKFSYAASFGASSPLPEDSELVIDALNKFKFISVRERSSTVWLESVGLPARNDLDPTLLHPRAFWDEFAGPEPIRQPYVLTYQLHHTNGFSEILRKVRSRSGLPVVRVTPDVKHLVKSGKTKCLVTPEEWLSWIRGASYIVTDSFHCTVFALRFGRPLYVVPPLSYAERIVDLLERVDLNRLAISSANLDASGFSPEYDAQAVDVALSEMAVDSWKYIGDIVGETMESGSARCMP